MQIGEKQFIFKSDTNIVRSDIATFREWENGKISIDTAKGRICKRNGYGQNYLSDAEFFELAHQFGYYHKIYEADEFERMEMEYPKI